MGTLNAPLNVLCVGSDVFLYLDVEDSDIGSSSFEELFDDVMAKTPVTSFDGAFSIRL